MAASSSSKAALDNLYAAVRKDVEEQLASRSAALDRREAALDTRERVLENREKADGNSDEKRLSVRVETLHRVEGLCATPRLAEEPNDADSSQAAAACDETVSSFTGDAKSDTPTSSRRGKFFGRAASPEKEKGPPMGSTGSNGGGRGAQWWERQKENTKSLMNKATRGRLSSTNEDGNADNTGTGDASLSKSQEDVALLESVHSQKIEEEVEPAPKKKPWEKKTSLFDDEPEAADATGAKPSNVPKFSYSSGADPLGSGQVPVRRAPPANPFAQAENKPAPSLPKDLVNLLGNESKAMADSPTNGVTSNSASPQQKAPTPVEPPIVEQVAPGKKPSEVAASGNKLPAGFQPLGSQPVKSSLFEPPSSQPLKTAPLPAKTSLFEEPKRGSSDAIDGSNPGSASELRAAFEKKRLSGGPVVPQKSAPVAGGSKVPPPKKSFADLP